MIRVMTVTTLTRRDRFISSVSASLIVHYKKRQRFRLSQSSANSRPSDRFISELGSVFSIRIDRPPHSSVRSASLRRSPFLSGVVGAFVRSRLGSMSGRGGGGRGGYGGRLERLRSSRRPRLGADGRAPRAKRVLLKVDPSL